MDKRDLITKIALGVALLAFVFSAITLIRAIVLGAGVLFAVIQVIVTLIIVAICAVMLYVIRREEAEAGEDETPPEAEIQEPQEEAPAGEDSIAGPILSEIDDKYHFENFE